MIVFDASAVVELLLGGERGQAALSVLEEQEGEAHAPALLDVEVAQVLRRLVTGGAISEARGGASIEILQDLRVERHTERPLLPRIWQLRENLTAYDAAYVALAEALACPLVTFDARIRNAPGVRAEIVVPGS